MPMVDLSPLPWYADPFWAFLGVVAQVVSLLAIAFAVYELVSRGWRVTGSVIAVHSWAHANHTATGRPVHVTEILNAGGAPALLTAVVVVHGEILPDPDNRVKYWLAPGESMNVMVYAVDPSKVWFRFQWMSPNDRRFAFGSWEVLEPDTSLSKQWSESYDRTKGLPWYLAPFRGYFAHMIGPGADSRTRIRLTRNLKKSHARLERVFGEVEDATAWVFKGMKSP